MMSGESVQTDDLLCRAQAGDRQALAALFDRYRGRLRHMVRLRLDRRLAGRIDTSDVLQEAYIEADRRFAEYVRDPAMPVFLWLRLVTGQKLIDLHRHHLGHEDARRRAGGLAPPRRPAAGQLGLAGRAAAGPAHLADPRGAAGRDAACGSRRRSTAWTRSTARSWPCATSRS